MGDGRTILLIDDEALIIETFSEDFAPHFERILTASNGREALDLCKAEPIDIIISDIDMPGMRGDEFLRQIRGTGIQTPVIFLTGVGGREVVLTALRLGAADVVEKPVYFRDLLATVHRVLEIERRKNQLGEIGKTVTSEEKVLKEKKMLGLLQVANEQKKKTS